MTSFWYCDEDSCSCNFHRDVYVLLLSFRGSVDRKLACRTERENSDDDDDDVNVDDDADDDDYDNKKKKKKKKKVVHSCFCSLVCSKSFITVFLDICPKLIGVSCFKKRSSTLPNAMV